VKPPALSRQPSIKTVSAASSTSQHKLIFRMLLFLTADGR